MRQFRDIIAQSAGAEGAEISQIFAELRRLDAGGFGQRLAGDGAEVVFAKPRKAAQINREAINRLARDDGAAGSIHRRKLQQ